jgi:maltose alpha-D-glucosyltransferase / alpha-amylase
VHPEVEVARFLTEEAGFTATPPYLGSLESVAPDGSSTALAIAQRFVRNQGDAWSWTLNALTREFETLALVAPEVADPIDETFAAYMPYTRILGRRTAEMHLAFATPTSNPAFAAEPLTLADVEEVARDARALADRAFAGLDRTVAPDERAAHAIADLRERRQDVYDLIGKLTREPVNATKTRVHGDYHLGQVLIVRDDVLIVDFEGEPSRPPHERRMKSTPLRDVAGMLRSFAYAVETAVRDIRARLPDGAGRVEVAAKDVLILVERVFLAAYAEIAQGGAAWVGDDATRTSLLRLQLLSKALYEIGYEADNRPDWIEIPVRGVLGILNGEVVR